jgi:hypothetical protein
MSMEPNKLLEGLIGAFYKRVNGSINEFRDAMRSSLLSGSSKTVDEDAAFMESTIQACAATLRNDAQMWYAHMRMVERVENHYAAASRPELVSQQPAIHT